MVSDAKQSEQNWILRALVTMAGADGRLDSREVALIQQVYQDLSGESLTAPDIAKAADAYAQQGDFLAELGAAADRLDMDDKEEIIRASYLVLLADDQIAGAEKKKLQDIAGALKVSEIHFGAILEDLAVWLASIRR